MTRSSTRSSWTRSRSRRAEDRARARGLGGRVDDARPRARHQLPVQRGGRPRGLPRRPLRGGREARHARRSRTSRTHSSTPTSSLVVFRTHNWRTLSKLAKGGCARPGVELGQAHLVGHDAAPVGRSARRCSARRPRCGVSGSASGCGARRRASPGGLRRFSATS